MSYRVSPDVFFLVEGDRLLVWNCRTHQQFLLEPEFTKALLNLQSTTDEQKSTLQQLMSAGIVINQPTTTNWGFDELSYLFHLGTKDIPFDDKQIDNAQSYADEYLDQCKPLAHTAPNWFQDKTGPLIDLPTPKLEQLNQPYHDVIKQRLTCRQFNGQSITQQQLSNFLHSSFGLIHGNWQCDPESGIAVAGIRKASASSGGLHAEEAYVVIYRVDGLQPGLYYYRPQDHKLNLISAGDYEQSAIQWNKQQYYSEGLAFGVYITARLDKYWWKYPHSRTYRIMLMDMGHVSQTCLLNATALGLQTWLTAALQDSPIEEFLQIDAKKESIMLFIGIGHGNANSLPKHFKQVGD